MRKTSARRRAPASFPRFPASGAAYANTPRTYAWNGDPHQAEKPTVFQLPYTNTWVPFYTEYEGRREGVYSVVELAELLQQPTTRIKGWIIKGTLVPRAVRHNASRGVSYLFNLKEVAMAIADNEVRLKVYPAQAGVQARKGLGTVSEIADLNGVQVSTIRKWITKAGYQPVAVLTKGKAWAYLYDVKTCVKPPRKRG